MAKLFHPIDNVKPSLWLADWVRAGSGIGANAVAGETPAGCSLSLRAFYYPQMIFDVCTCTSTGCVFYRWMLQLVASARSTQSAPDQWAVHEFGRCQMSDQRLTKRLARIASAFARQPTATIPQACGGWTSAKAAYRFFENQSVEPEQIVQGHQHATLERLRAHRIVLALQDTTSLNYSTHRATQGLGPIGTRGHRTVGLLAHSTLAVTPSGQALGLIHHRCHARSEVGSAKERHQKPVEQKESVKWLQSLNACQQLEI